MTVGVGSGRAATPIALRTLKGGNPGRLGLSQAINPPVLNTENAAEWRDALLDDDLAKWLWDRYVRDGREAKILAQWDVGMLAALCTEQSIYFRAAREYCQLAKEGHWGKLVAEKGGAYKGAMAVGNKAFEKVIALATQFGMTPSSRAKMSAIDTQMDMWEAMNEQNTKERAQRLAATLNVVLKDAG